MRAVEGTRALPACVTVKARRLMATETEIDLEIPADMRLLASLSWFDQDFWSLAPIDMLSRYEAGWRHRGVLAEPSAEELRFIRALVHRFGSILKV